jgi:hypothetical protein
MNNKIIETNAGPKPDEIELLKRDIAKGGPLNPYTRKEAENLLGMMERFNHEIETTHIPSDPKSRAIIERQWRGRLEVYGSILRNIIRTQAEQTPRGYAGDTYGKRGDDEPICMPHTNKVRLSERPTMDFPRPRK